jgi:hypothetical protein
VVFLTLRTLHQGRCRLVLVRPEAEIDISVGTESFFGIEPSDRPTLNQDRFNTRRPQKRDDFSNFALVQSSAYGVKAVCLFKL